MYTLPALPYAYDALAPTLSERTLRFHHDKHHATYVETVNARVGSRDDGASLEAVIRRAAGEGQAKLFNNAGQAWNHGFFWESMTASPLGAQGDLARALDAAFGAPGAFREAFIAKGVGHFGSGWLWLTSDGAGELKLVSTHDAKTPVTNDEATPLIVCDLWEHAYYLDYQNDRKGYLGAWFDALANWSFAEAQYGAARGDGQPWRYPPPIAEAEAKAA